MVSPYDICTTSTTSFLLEALTHANGKGLIESFAFEIKNLTAKFQSHVFFAQLVCSEERSTWPWNLISNLSHSQTLSDAYHNVYLTRNFLIWSFLLSSNAFMCKNIDQIVSLKLSVLKVLEKFRSTKHLWWNLLLK